MYYTSVFQLSGGNSISTHGLPLTSLVQSRTSNHVRVNIAKVERRQERVIIRDSNEHSPVDSRVALVSRHIRLDSLSVAGVGDLQRGVSNVKLVGPHNPLGVAGGGGGGVAVVRADCFTGLLPGEVDLATGPGERHGAVVRDSRAAVLADLVGPGAGVGAGVLAQGVHARLDGFVPRLGAVDAAGVWLVDDREGREVLPGQTGLVGGARADVWSEQCPCPGLGDADLEPDGHGEEAFELAEDHLLTRFGGDGLRQEGGCLAGVEVAEEAIDAGFAESGQLLGEVEEFPDGLVGVVVGALLRGSSAEDVGQHCRVSDFLVGHEFDQETVFSGETGLFEVFDRESSKSVVEEVEFDEFLVDTQSLNS